MSKATHLLGAAVALLAVSPAAAQSSAPEPPRVPPAAVQPASWQTPPGATQDKPYGAKVATANERAERENFARRQAVQQAASRHDAVLFNTMILNVGAVMQSPAPMTPVTGPGGCHPGHDKTAHPGGCHSPRGGTAN